MFDDTLRACRTADRQTVEYGSSNGDGPRAQGERPENVDASANSAIEYHWNARIYRRHDLREDADGARYAIDLPATVVRYLNCRCTSLDCHVGVTAAHDAFDDHRQPGRGSHKSDIVGGEVDLLVRKVSATTVTRIVVAKRKAGRERTPEPNEFVALSGTERVRRDDDGAIAGVARALQQAAGDADIGVEIELEPLCAIRGRGYLLKGLVGRAGRLLKRARSSGSDRDF
jgi:hypothetical protein